MNDALPGLDDAKRLKFVELAERRTRTAMRAIRILAKLGDPHRYRFDERDVERIAGTLTREVEALRIMMLNGGKRREPEFSLGETASRLPRKGGTQ